MESKCSCPECLIFMLLFWNRFTFSCHTTFRILYSEGSPNSCSGTLLFILNPVMMQPLNSIPNSDKNKKSCFGIVFYRPHVFVIRFLWDILEKYSSCTSAFSIYIGILACAFCANSWWKGFTGVFHALFIFSCVVTNLQGCVILIPNCCATSDPDDDNNGDAMANVGSKRYVMNPV